ncbi:MAG: DUF2157 domain-containing protein [Clostridia bacterium]|nr:DUF2157 domain-containing protein [Clostridia bacterium]
MEEKKRKIKLFYTIFAIFGALVFCAGIALIIVAVVNGIKPAILFGGVLLVFLGFAFTDMSIRHLGKLKKGLLPKALDVQNSNIIKNDNIEDKDNENIIEQSDEKNEEIGEGHD